MRDEKSKYYAYDKKKERFVIVDGELALVSKEFKDEMLNMNSSFMIFIKKEDYEKYGGKNFSFEAMSDGEEV